MISLWRSEQITGPEMDSWLAAVPFQTRAKPNMLSALLVSHEQARPPPTIVFRTVKGF